MAFVNVNFGKESIETLKSKGVKVSGVTGDRMIEDQSWFEPPLSVQAKIPSYAFLQIGAFTSISGGSIRHVSIGRYCALAPDVMIGAHEHPTDWLTVSRLSHVRGLHGWDEVLRPDGDDQSRHHVVPFNGSSKRTTIGNDVWLGQGVFIRAGVTIGDGAIIAGCSVVTKDVAPYSVVAGIPAQTKRLRFPETTVERLLKLQWWRYSLYDFDQIPYDRIDDALDAIEDQIGQGKIKPYEPDPVRLADLASK